MPPCAPHLLPLPATPALASSRRCDFPSRALTSRRGRGGGEQERGLRERWREPGWWTEVLTPSLGREEIVAFLFTHTEARLSPCLSGKHPIYRFLSHHETAATLQERPAAAPHLHKSFLSPIPLFILILILLFSSRYTHTRPLVLKQLPLTHTLQTLQYRLTMTFWSRPPESHKSV